ncbi:IclR family transcriptional regulator [Cellulomonas dongxiuzhuiae]|uniref:IclR family transcriptional regulator n=1 Tax=Cellulomonas dongxiuzhuiae TaxID=2819979 RepID=A0ABX8GJ37_9CELL|nr:IclR family transcriptional regulator [Cellulomonas dongxiuzhuiae]MBO3095216.1 IclR family transcriptional regulator [Cellulomonas dongxiuzhuiae]QWC16214.1 IclR family transcriptional regulator [Cellulomonas dongxiuzhuiae]
MSTTPDVEARPGRNESLSLRRALALLDVCAAETDPAGLTAAEIGRRLDVHKSTVLRLAAPLLESELLRRDAVSGRFRLGPGALRLGHAYLASLDIESVAASALDDLARTSGCTSVLAVPDGLQVRLAGHRSAPGSAGRTAGRLPATVPLHCSASGKAILSVSGAALVERAVAGGLRSVTTRSITDPGELRAELLRTRRRGFAVDDRELDPDIRAVAAPVLDHTGDVVGALTLVAPAARMPAAAVQEHARSVVLAARAVSRRLGGAIGPRNVGGSGEDLQARRGA